MKLFETVLKVHAAGLARVAATYEADRSLREDLVQDILLAVHLSLHSLEHPDRLRAFVYRIAHNQGVNHVIRRSSLKRRDATVDPDDGHLATPEDELLSTERARRLAAAVRRLPLPYRQVISLLLEDLSYAEIGDALGLTHSNVGVRINRAKTILRELLNER